jgi:4-amino-4-deoxy-L-arabinose transferase-like glycosyltransferase
LPTSKLAKHGWKVLFLAVGAFYLYGLGALPLVGPDEPRYAEVAREMLARRDLITPTLGGMPWFEKPSLLYWLIMAGYRVFGVTEFAARIGPALCGLLSAAFVYWLGRNIERAQSSEGGQPSTNLGRWSALVFLSSFGAIVFSRAASFDIVLTMTMTGALCFFFVADLRSTAGGAGKQVTGLLFGFYAFVGLSLLAKGLLGLVLPFGIIATYFLMRGERPRRTLVVSLTWGIPFALLVAATWYGPMIYLHRWTFIDQFIIQHHFARFFSKKYHHPQPFYFYLPIVALLCAPWTLFLMRACVRAVSGYRKRLNERVLWFAMTWLILPLIFFSFSSTKLPGYILPVLPAVAILVGHELTRFANSASTAKLIRLSSALFIAGAAVGAWYAVRQLGIPSSLAATGALLAIIIAGFSLINVRRTKTLILPLALASFAALAVGITGAKVIANRESVRDLMRTADARGYSAAPVYYLLCDDHSAEFYAGGRLAYQPNGEPVRFDGAQDVAAAIREKGGVGLVLVETRWEKQLTDYSKVSTEKIGNNDWYSLFVVRVQ